MSDWQIFRKKTSGKFEKYKMRTCLIVSQTNRPRLVLTPATLRLLGIPDRVLILFDGDGKIAVQGIKKGDQKYSDAYAITYGGNEPASHTFGYVNAATFIDEAGLKKNTVCEKVYIEGDYLVASIDDFRPAEV